MTDASRRALIAAAAGLLGSALGIAGTGHAYLGEWRRAVAWFSFVFGAGLVLVSALADPRTVTLSTLPLEVVLPLVGLLVLNTADAYRVGTRQAGGSPVVAGDGRDGAAPSCAHCGRTLDPRMDFCWYCAERSEE